MEIEDLSKNEIENNDIFIKVRSTGRLIKARIKLHDNDAEVNLLETESGVSPGQACVFYSGTRVLGGGWITK